MKYEMLVLTTVKSRIIVETDEKIPDLCKTNDERNKAIHLVNRMMEAAENYVAQNNLVAVNLRDGNWEEHVEYVGKADQESIDKEEHINLEEWE